MTPNCPLCREKEFSAIYTIDNMPIFQNKVYASKDLALNAISSNIILSSCHCCGFVFNSSFDQALMTYDTHYENEQAHSPFFQHYLASIIELFSQKSFQDKKIIEIGCGKGFFLEKLNAAGFYVTGFDPAYIGNNPHIIKDFFSGQYANLSAQIIVLRHVLEHIQSPLNFLHTIGQAVNYEAKIYIEVPSLEWILKNNAFWDIFYEHCNYFTLDSLNGLFKNAEKGFLFNGQYIYLIADLKNLKDKGNSAFNVEITACFLKFKNSIANFQKSLTLKKGLALWGAGAKGVTLANLIDPERKLISYLIDINDKKQNHYIGKSAHEIISPSTITDTLIKDILVMNENYFDEINDILFSLSLDRINVEAIKINPS